MREHPQQAQAIITAYLKRQQPYLFIDPNADVDTNTLRIITESVGEHQHDTPVARQDSGLRQSVDHSPSSPRRNSQQFWQDFPTQPYADDDPPSLSQPTPTTTLPLALSDGQSRSNDSGTTLNLNKYPRSPS